MTHILIGIVVLAFAGAAWWFAGTHRDAPRVRVTIRLDRDTPGAHLIWDVTNVGDRPVTITKLIVYGRQATKTIPLSSPRLLNRDDGVLLPSDVDWSVLTARAIAVGDLRGREYRASRRELATIQDHLRQHIDRRAPTTSAREFLVGASNLAFGVVILGLGFFMLMWVIATG